MILIDSFQFRSDMIDRFKRMNTSTIQEIKYVSQGLEALTSETDKTPEKAQVSLICNQGCQS